MMPGNSQIRVFSNVNVVTMESEEILENRNVVVADDIILSIGQDSHFPSGASVIDGRGKFLMPGLVDMHVHLNSPHDLTLYIANGVTTVRNMREFRMYGLYRNAAKIREEIKRGRMLGPTIYTTGFIYDSRPAIPSPPFRKGTERLDSKDKVEQLLTRDQERGYDFIKIYNHLSQEVYEEIVNVAAKLDLPVVGHVPDAVGIDLALDSKQRSVEHLTGYDQFIQEGSILNEEKLDQLVQKTVRNNVWNCPTLVVYTRYVPTEMLIDFENKPEMRYISSVVKLFWRFGKRKFNRLFEKNKWEYLADSVGARKRMVKKLYDAGAGLLLGTDSMDPYVVPGFAVHEELKLLVEAGLTPFEAIKTGTVNAARFLEPSDQFGTVGVGKRADLLLVESNPLENIESVKKQSGVMVRGEWIPREQIQELLNRIAKKRTR